jgi:hypothetical protein
MRQSLNNADLPGHWFAAGRARLRTMALASAAVGIFVTSQPASADCFDDAATYHHVNADVLRAIAWEESHNRPDARHTNTDGSIDYGLMQINSVHLETLARFGIGTADLMVPCKSLYIAAWHLQRQMAKYGNTWAAIGAYHSATPALRDAYAARIATRLAAFKDARENGH